jgi:transposase
VSKATLDVAVRPIYQRWSVANREKGFNPLVRRLKTVSPALIVLEATGGLELPVVAALGAAGLPVVVVNPKQVRDFAKATGKLAKTDLLDAEARALSALLARPRQLIVMLTAERNRLSRALPSIRPGVEEHIAWLKEKLRAVDTHGQSPWHFEIFQLCLTPFGRVLIHPRAKPVEPCPSGYWSGFPQ